MREARRLLLEGGYGALTMDRVAEALEYSRGTLYLHFQSKGDLVCALVLEALQGGCSLLEKVDAFKALSREKAVAWGFVPTLLRCLHPEYELTHVLLRSTIGEKASEERLGAMKKVYRAIQNHLLGTVRMAVEEGSLLLRRDTEANDLLFGLASLSWGAAVLGEGKESEKTLLRQISARGDISRNIDALLDGYGWRPLSGEKDYGLVRRRIRNDVFREEMDELERRGRVMEKSSSPSNGGVSA